MPETFKTKGALKFHLRIKHFQEIDQQENQEVMSEPESCDEGDKSRRLKSPTFSEPSRSPPPRSPPALVRSSYYNPPTNPALIRFLETKVNTRLKTLYGKAN